MGTASSSTASPTVPRQHENAYITVKRSHAVAAEESRMALTFNSQIHHSDDTLMNLQELDSHLAIFEESADSGQGLTPDPQPVPDLPPDASLLPSAIVDTGRPDESSLAISPLIVTATNAVKVRSGAPAKDIDPKQPPQNFRPFIKEVVQIKEENAGSSMSSIMTDRSELSSALSSTSSKATSPVELETSRETTQVSSQTVTQQETSRPAWDIKPRSSIPTDLDQIDYASQCIIAAENSRLHPTALHPGEYALLRSHLNRSQVTTYLNIRNGILRLWMRNPQIAVTRKEAIGCARDSRWFDVANVCYEWLLRHGYINFGCFQLDIQGTSRPRPVKGKRLRIVVVGAGVAGLTCARQLEGLFAQHEDRFREKNQALPEVIVLEGRNRIGGRVYSRPLKTKPSDSTTLNNGSRCTAEMGGMIIIGFERGNPLNVLVRNQLALPYYALIPELIIYDTNGQPVDGDRDKLNESLHNYTLERVSKYKYKVTPPVTVEGNKDFISTGRDTPGDNGPPMSQTEDSTVTFREDPVGTLTVTGSADPQPSTGVTASADRVTGRAHLEAGPIEKQTAAHWARMNGWPLKANVTDDADINLETAAAAAGATLGSVMDDFIEEFKSLAHVLPLDYRLQSWHAANLEYANAQMLRSLSLPGWDTDAGNEWEGVHSMIIGGYQQVAHGLMMCPSPLKVRKNAVVSSITWNGEKSPAAVRLEDGTTIAADHVVCTVPLGVLKSKTIEFEPPLPEWKTEAIDRMGFGVLNKVILVFKQQFWDQDFFGILRDPINRASLDMKDYHLKRGRFFQFVSCTASSGVPVLAALMAGDTALEVEKEPDHVLIGEASAILRNIFGERMSEPVEAIVTRWGSDKFARGSYSSAGPNFLLNDYHNMAKRAADTLFFAGEHTSATHPATVHGAILSGLRAAAELYETVDGPIDIPKPLVPPKESKGLKRKASSNDPNSKGGGWEAYDLEISSAIHQRFGPPPQKPPKAATPSHIYTNDHFEATKRRMETARRGRAKVKPNDVRSVLSREYNTILTEAEKQPYVDRAALQQQEYPAKVREFQEALSRWTEETSQFRESYEKAHPPPPGPDEQAEEDMSSPSRRARKARRVGVYAEPSDSDMV